VSNILGIKTGHSNCVFSIDSMRATEAFERVSILLNIVALDGDMAPGTGECLPCRAIQRFGMIGHVGRSQVIPLAGSTPASTRALKEVSTDILNEKYFLDATECQQALRIKL